MNGLQSVAYVGDILDIHGNNLITNLNALNNISYVNSTVYIAANESLTDLCGVHQLVVNIYNNHNGQYIELSNNGFNPLNNTDFTNGNCKL